MDVSENNGTPKSSILIGFSIINHPFWGTTIFGNTHIQDDKSQRCVQELRYLSLKRMVMSKQFFTLAYWGTQLFTRKTDDGNTQYDQRRVVQKWWHFGLKRCVYTNMNIYWHIHIRIRILLPTVFSKYSLHIYLSIIFVKQCTKNRQPKTHTQRIYTYIMYYISNIVFFIIYDRLYMYIYHEFHIPPGLRVFFVEGDGSLALPSSSFGTAPWRPFWGFMKYWNVRIRADKYIYIYINISNL